MKWKIQKIVNSYKPIAYSRDNMGTCSGERNTIWKEELLQSDFLTNALGIEKKVFDIKYMCKVLNKPLTSILLAKDYILTNFDLNWERVNTDRGLALWDLLTRMVEAYEQKKEWNYFNCDILSQLWEALIESFQRNRYNYGLSFKFNSLGVSYNSLEYGCYCGEDSIRLAYDMLAQEFGIIFTSQITSEEFRDIVDEDDISACYSAMRSELRKEVNEKYHLTYKKIIEICKDFESANQVVSEPSKLIFSKGEQVKFHLNLYTIMVILHEYGDILPVTVTAEENIWRSGEYYVYDNVNIEKKIWELYALTKRYLDYNILPRPEIKRDDFLCHYYEFLFLAVQKIFKRGASANFGKTERPFRSSGTVISF